MTLLAQISDLHFGTESAELADALCHRLWQLRPSLVINCGDLTQRARASQFNSAAEFHARLPSPQLIVPGNHDVPLYHLFRRFLAPFAGYRRFVSPELNPVFSNGELLVQGLNTARSLTWKNGRISCRQMELVERTFSQGRPGQFRILVTHHPFLPPPGSYGRVALVGRAREALAVMDRSRVDLLLAGHLHHGYSGDVRTFYPAAYRSMIAVQVGTGISRRLRTEPNAFNLIELDANRISVTTHVWNGHRFHEQAAVQYHLQGEAWIRDPVPARIPV